MNKLVSKNPVQRFKQGKKIVKAKNSWGSNFGVYTFTPTNEQNIRERINKAAKEAIKNTKEITPAEQGRYNRGDHNGDFEQSLKEGTFPGTYGLGNVSDLISMAYENDSRARHLIDDLPTIAIEAIKQETENAPKPVIGPTYTISSNGNSETQVKNKSQIQNKKTKTRKSGTSSFAKAFNQARNSKQQEFTYNGKKYNTMKAGETKDQWLAGLKGQQTSHLNQVAPVTSSPMFTAPKFDQQPVATNAPKPTYNFNRSQIRDMIRQGGFNPYNYSGEQRKALRLYLNGQSNDTSLLDGTDLARFTLPFRKQGGQLPSRNIIERFKLKIKK